jgi:hypothetical protein
MREPMSNLCRAAILALIPLLTAATHGGQRMEISEELQCMSQGDYRRHNDPDAGHEHP